MSQRSSTRWRTDAWGSPCSTSPPSSRCPRTARCGSCPTSCSRRTPPRSARTSRGSSPSCSPRTRADCSTANRCTTSSTPASSTDATTPERTSLVRTVISVIVALVASIVGTLLLWYGGGHTVDALGGFDGFGPAGAGLSPLLAALGCALLALAALSVRWSRWGAIAAGALHVAFSLLAVTLPVAPAEGIPSPTIRVLNALLDVDP